MIHTQTISYHDDDTTLIGWMANDPAISGKKPIVLVAHDWSGRNEFACKKAEQLAGLGYIGFALDLYGQAQLGKTNDEKSALMAPFMSDRTFLLRRIRAAVGAVKTIQNANPNQIAAIGFCFGGLCVLDLARHSNDILGVVSLHGLLLPSHKANAPMTAKVLALHGHDDPMVNPEQVLAFQNEMTTAKADWQMMIFGGTKHAFTNPLANDPAFGTVYNAVADYRSWHATKQFLTDLFTK